MGAPARLRRVIEQYNTAINSTADPSKILEWKAECQQHLDNNTVPDENQEPLKYKEYMEYIKFKDSFYYDNRPFETHKGPSNTHYLKKCYQTTQGGINNGFAPGVNLNDKTKWIQRIKDAGLQASQTKIEVYLVLGLMLVYFLSTLIMFTHNCRLTKPLLLH